MKTELEIMKKLIVCLLLFTILFSFISCNEKNPQNEDQNNSNANSGDVTETALDFFKDDLSEYVEISALAYSTFEFNTVNPVPLELEVSEAVIRTLYKYRTVGDGALKTDAVITVGDIARIYYMGYTLDGGTKGYINGGCNLYGQSSDLGIGSGQFIPGFEFGLIGKNPKDHITLKKASEIGESTLFLVISYTLENADGSAPQKAVINLRDTDIDEKYGTGFKALITDESVAIGKALTADFTSDKGGTYTDITVTKAFDANDGSLPILTVETYFPIDYQEASLRGKLVYFDVFVESVNEYDVPEFNDSFITDKLNVSIESLSEYEGDTLTEKYRSSVKASVEASRDELLTSMLTSAIFEHICNYAIYKKLPQYDLEQIYNEYLQAIQSKYNMYAAYYGSFDEFARAYWGLGESDNWQLFLQYCAESPIKEKLAIFGAFRDRGFVPDEAELEVLYNAFIDKQFEYYNGNSIAPGTPQYEEARKNYEKELIASYGEARIKESVWYEYGMEKLIALMYTKASD